MEENERITQNRFSRVSRWGRIILKYVKESLASFPATQLSIWAGTVYLALLFSVDLPEAGMYFLFVFGSGAFFTESLFLMRRKSRLRDPLRLLLYLAAAVCGVVFSRALEMEADVMLWGMEAGILQEYLGRYALCFFLAAYLLAFYFMYRAARMKPEDYLVHLFTGVLRTGILYTVLTVGASMVLGIGVSLFEAWYDRDFDLILQSHCILFGFVFLSGLLRCLMAPGEPERPERRESMLEEVLIKYVLAGLVCCVFALVYAYVLKLLLLRTMPSNEVFPILASLFVVGLPVWTMNARYREKSPLSGICEKMPWLFGPLILLQGYCMGIRIYENGITPSRYAGMVFLIVELVYIAIYRFRRQAVGLLLPVGAALVLAASLLPGVNMYAASVRSQRKDLERLLEKPEEALTEEELLRLRGAYAYLEEDPAGKKYLNSLTGTLLEKTGLLAAGNYAVVETTLSFSADVPDDSVDVEGFCRLWPVHINNRGDAEKAIDLTDFALSAGEEQNVPFDLEGYLKPLLEWRKEEGGDGDEEEMRELLLSNQRICLDEHFWLQINGLSFRYDKELEGYVRIQMSGYLLEK